MIGPRYAGLLLGMFAVGWFGSHQSCSAALLEARTPTEVAAMFKPDAPGWAAHARGYGGPASGIWSFALAGEASWSNYAVDCRLALVRPADRHDGMELGAFVAFADHANLGGYEAGIILRYQSPQKFYRVAVSSLWKEVIDHAGWDRPNRRSGRGCRCSRPCGRTSNQIPGHWAWSQG